MHNCHTQHSTQQLWLFSLCTSTPSTQLRCYLLESSLASRTERITFKVVTLTYHALHGSAPPYLAPSFTCVADMPHQRRLRFASTEQLDVPTCRRSTIGGRVFPIAGANGLPSDVTSASSQPVSKNRLKTYLFRRCYYETVWLWITFFPSHYLPSRTVVLAIVFTV